MKRKNCFFYLLFSVIVCFNICAIDIHQSFSVNGGTLYCTYSGNDIYSSSDGHIFFRNEVSWSDSVSGAGLSLSDSVTAGTIKEDSTVTIHTKETNFWTTFIGLIILTPGVPLPPVLGKDSVTLYFFKDSVAPIASCYDSTKSYTYEFGETYYSVGKKSIKFSVNDAGSAVSSGIKWSKIYKKFNDEKEVEISGDEIILTKEGTYRFRCEAVDNVNNTLKTKDVVFVIDGSDPKVTATCDTDIKNGKYLKENTKVTIAITDSTSGILTSEIRVSYENAAPEVYKDITSKIIALNREGTYKISCKAEDKCGNYLSETVFEYVLDKTAPKVYFDSLECVSPKESKVVQIKKIVIEDANIAKKEIYLNNKLSPDLIGTDLAGVQHEGTLRIEVEDKAGNKKTVNNYYLYNRAPTIQVTNCVLKTKDSAPFVMITVAESGKIKENIKSFSIKDNNKNYISITNENWTYENGIYTLYIAAPKRGMTSTYSIVAKNDYGASKEEVVSKYYPEKLSPLLELKNVNNDSDYILNLSFANEDKYKGVNVHDISLQKSFSTKISNFENLNQESGYIKLQTQDIHIPKSKGMGNHFFRAKISYKIDELEADTVTAIIVGTRNQECIKLPNNRAKIKVIIHDEYKNAVTIEYDGEKRTKFNSSDLGNLKINNDGKLKFEIVVQDKDYENINVNLMRVTTFDFDPEHTEYCELKFTGEVGKNTAGKTSTTCNSKTDIYRKLLVDNDSTNLFDIKLYYNVANLFLLDIQEGKNDCCDSYQTKDIIPLVLMYDEGGFYLYTREYNDEGIHTIVNNELNFEIKEINPSEAKYKWFYLPASNLTSSIVEEVNRAGASDWRLNYKELNEMISDNDKVVSSIFKQSAERNGADSEYDLIIVREDSSKNYRKAITKKIHAMDTSEGELCGNETWIGLHNLVGNVIVPNGKTLRIIPVSKEQTKTKTKTSVQGYGIYSSGNSAFQGKITVQDGGRLEIGVQDSKDKEIIRFYAMKNTKDGYAEIKDDEELTWGGINVLSGGVFEGANGFEIKDTNVGISINSKGNISISDGIFRNNKTAVSVEGKGNIRISDVDLLGKPKSFEEMSDGIALKTSGAIELSNINISDYLNNAISILGNGSTKLTQNLISVENCKNGILVKQCGNVRIQKMSVKSCSNGLILRGNDSVTVTTSDFEHNTRGVVCDKGISLTIEDSSLSNNDIGLHVIGGRKVEIKESRIENNRKYGIKEDKNGNESPVVTRDKNTTVKENGYTGTSEYPRDHYKAEDGLNAAE